MAHVPVLAVADNLHLALELPDSRYLNFARVGALQLIADNACAGRFLLSEATTPLWRTRALVTHEGTMRRNDPIARTGPGASVLGNPRTALTWMPMNSPGTRSVCWPAQ